jgi:hypothetical protein
VTDPDTGHAIVSASTSFGLTPAVDPHNGNLYVTWEDNRFSGGQYSSIAFAMSSDGGLTWSMPIKVNQTPTNLPPGDQQAFLPSVQVADNGTVAVTYFDFRYNDPNPGLPTDYWVAHADAGGPGGFTNPANWSQENRLTNQSFNFEAAEDISHGGPYFLGDYMGLASAGNNFAAVWSQTQGTDPGNIEFRFIDPPSAPSSSGTDLPLLEARPQISSFSASPNPVTAGSNLTLTAGNITDANSGATVIQVAFYLDSNSDGLLNSGDTLLGDGTQTGTGTWTFTFSTAGLTSGTYTFFAVADDGYGVLGDPAIRDLVSIRR